MWLRDQFQILKDTTFLAFLSTFHALFGFDIPRGHASENETSVTQDIWTANEYNDGD